MAENIGEPENRFQQLQVEAKNLASNGKIAESIKLFQEAYAINPTKKVKKRIEKLQAFLEEYGDEIEESMIEICDNFHLYHDLYKKLYMYQKDGVKWLWNLFKKKKGGVLGDDMGLGKTIQIIAFLSGMFDMDAIKSVLIIMPVSLLPNWEKEFLKWTPGLPTQCFHGQSKREREKMLIRTQNRGGVLLTSYGMIVNNIDLITYRDNKEFVWDYVILDEAHKIKNPTKTTKAVHAIPARNRIALTGTPIQNNLKELWSLYDFVHQGTLLGSLQTFRMQYETPITRSREKDATVGERRLGTVIAENLLTLIQPYFLRRTKAEVLNQNDKTGDNSTIDEMNLRKEFFISRKNDFIIWLYLSPKQMTIYKDFLELDRVKDILMTKRSPLVELTVLKKICDHPRLLSKRACIQLGLDGDVPADVEEELDEDTASVVSIDNVTDDDLIEESGKLTFLLSLLSNLRETDHRTLVFSLSRKMLDIIHRILVNRNWKVMRVDGTINKIERQKRIQHFQEDLSIPVFLLTTQVGGVGFTLTGADRVIIYDPSWNPATDAQAVDRAYRIGQDKNVVIYRLITCSTVEEKIYRRQIFKDSITRQATGMNKDPHRYFTKQELRELFTIENPYHSATQVQLEEMHVEQRHSDVKLDGHIAFLYSLNIFGISDHDLMFSGEQVNDAENYGDEIMGDEYIKHRVETAQQLLSIESAQTLEDNTKANIYARAYTLPTNTVRNNTTKDMYKPPIFPDVDLNDIDKSLQHMSFQDDSVNIYDSSVTPNKKTDHVVNMQLELPSDLENFSLKTVANTNDGIINNQIYSIECAQTLDDDAKSNVNTEPDAHTTIFLQSDVTEDSHKSLAFPDAVDTKDVNRSLSHMSFQEDSVNIYDSNVIPNKKIEHAADIQLDLPIGLKCMEKSSKTIGNADEAMFVLDNEDDNQENQITFANAMETSTHRRPRKSILYVPESDDEETDSDASKDLFVPDSEESNESSTPSPNPNVEYRNEQVHYKTSLLQKRLHNWKTDHPDNFAISQLEQKVHPISTSIVIDDDDNAQFPKTSRLSNHASEVEKFTGLCCSKTEVPVISLTTDSIEEADIELPDISRECEKNILQSDSVSHITSFSGNQTTTSEFDHNSKIAGHNSYKKESQSPSFSTPMTNRFSPISSKRITPLKIPQLQTFSPENSSFQRALLQSTELYPTTSSPLHATDVQKVTYNLKENNTVPLKSIENCSPWSFKSAKRYSSRFHKNTPMSEASLTDRECKQSFVFANSGDKLIEKSENSSFVRNLSHELEQVSQYNESGFSPVNPVRKHCQRILDSSDESGE